MGHPGACDGTVLKTKLEVESKKVTHWRPHSKGQKSEKSIKELLFEIWAASN